MLRLFGTSQQVHADDLAFIARHLAAPCSITHARETHPGGSYQLGSMEKLDVADHRVAGIPAWGSLIHLPPPKLDDVLAEFRRVMAPAGALVVGIFVHGGRAPGAAG